MTEPKKTGGRRYKKRLRKGRLFFSLVLICLLMGSCFAAGMRIYNRFFRPRAQVAETKDDGLTTEGFSKRINVLLLGTDDGDSEDFGTDAPKRTDAMLLVSIDPEHNQVAVLSLPRDTRVTIPGRRGHDKINAAYAYGGVPLAKKTVSNLLQVPINHYMQVDWKGFIKVVDMLGGVDLNVEENMDYEDPYADLKIHLKKGQQHLDGEKAGEYVRFRHDEMGDIGRVKRQQNFMKALAKQAFTVTNMVKLPMIIGTATEYVKTDMDFIQLVKAANSLRAFGDGGVNSASLKGDFGDIGGVSYWVTTPSKIAATLDELKIPHKKIPSI
jgi:LCP family protein required for cell wall assembly